MVSQFATQPRSQRRTIRARTELSVIFSTADDALRAQAEARRAREAGLWVFGSQKARRRPRESKAFVAHASQHSN